MKYILVIDDSITIRMSVELCLKHLGLRIRMAENGSDALLKMQEIKKSGNTVSLYITDINMPVMDGIAFIKEVRKSDKFNPILILTTESDQSKIQAGKEAGASGWIIKPFKPSEMVSVVQKFIK